MIEKFFQINKIGKELGLTKKEINRILLFENTKYPLLFKILMIILFIFLGFVIIIIGIEAAKNIYPAGALYSTVKRKDFRQDK